MNLVVSRLKKYVFKFQKWDLRQIATELGEKINEKITFIQLTEIIIGNKYCISDIQFVMGFINSSAEDCKTTEQKKVELEGLKSEKACQ